MEHNSPRNQSHKCRTGWVAQSNDNYDIMFSFWKRVFYGVSCLLEVSMLLEMSKKYPFKKMKNYALSNVKKGPLKKGQRIMPYLMSKRVL